MRRPFAFLAAAAVIGCLLPSPAEADPNPVLDGKVRTYVSRSAPAARGAVAPFGPTDDQVIHCSGDECARLPFVYKPAAGVPRDLGMSLGWYFAEATRLDLFLVTGNKVVARCGGKVANTRRVVVPAKLLSPGTTYTAVMFTDYSTTADIATLAATLPAVNRGQGFDPSDPFNLKYASCEP